jgi:hypothetical protein
MDEACHRKRDGVAVRTSAVPTREIGAFISVLVAAVVVGLAISDNRELFSPDTLPTGDMAEQSIVTWLASKFRAIHGEASWNGYFMMPTLAYLRAWFARLLETAGVHITLSGELVAFHLALLIVITISNYYLVYNLLPNAALAAAIAITFIVFIVSFGEQKAQVLIVPWLANSATLTFAPFVLSCAGVIAGRGRFVIAAIAFGALTVHTVLGMALGVALVFVLAMLVIVSYHGLRALSSLVVDPWLAAALSFGLYPFALDCGLASCSNARRLAAYVKGNLGKPRVNADEAWAMFVRCLTITHVSSIFLLAGAALSLTLLLSNRESRSSGAAPVAMALLAAGTLTILAAFITYRFGIPADYEGFHVGLFARIGLACIVSGVLISGAALLSEGRCTVLGLGIAFIGFAIVGLPGVRPSYKEPLNPLWMIHSSVAETAASTLSRVAAEGNPVALVELVSDPNLAGQNERAYHPYYLATAGANLLHRNGIAFCFASRPDSPGHVRAMADYVASRPCRGKSRSEVDVGWAGERAVLRLAGHSFDIYGEPIP